MYGYIKIERNIYELYINAINSNICAPSPLQVERRLERKLENIATKIGSRQKSDSDGAAPTGGITAASLSKSLTDVGVISSTYDLH